MNQQQHLTNSAMATPQSPYQLALNTWHQQFGQFVTLLRFNESMTATEQSSEQKNAFVEYVSLPGNFHALLSFDFGFSKLNTTFRNYVWQAHLSGEQRLRDAELQLKSAEIERGKLEKARLAEDQANQQARLVQTLAMLELKDQLLGIDKDFDTEGAARNSVYFKRAQQLADVIAVVKPKKFWHGTNEYDERGERLGHYTTKFNLTFELKPQVAA